MIYMLIKLSLVFIFLSISNFSSAELISRTVAEVNKEYITSREVVLSALISSCESTNCSNTTLNKINVKSDEFASLLSKSIFEKLAYYEAIGIFEKTNIIKPSLLSKVLRSKVSKYYKFSSNEVKKFYKLKLMSKNYIKFKDSNMSVYISDREALNYFNLNKSKYSKTSFIEKKADIKNQLQGKRKRKRVEDWVSSMQIKYKVRQLIN